METCNENKFSGGWDARLKVAVTAALVVAAVSSRPATLLPFALHAAVLAVFVLACGMSPLKFIKRAVMMEPFVIMAAALIPFTRHMPGEALTPVAWGLLHVSSSGMHEFFVVLSKGTLGVCALAALAATTPAGEIMSALLWYRVPPLLVQAAGLMLRYSSVISDEAQRMTRAAGSRGFRPIGLRDARVVGHLAGALFLRSYERAERVHAAMLSRGYSGEAAPAPLPGIRAAHVALSAAAAAAAIIIRIYAK